MSTKINSRSQTVYSFIEAYWKECGYAPTVDEIAQGVGLSYATTYLYLLDLRSWGAIDWTPRKFRTIHITGEYRRG